MLKNIIKLKFSSIFIQIYVTQQEMDPNQQHTDEDHQKYIESGKNPKKLEEKVPELVKDVFVKPTNFCDEIEELITPEKIREAEKTLDGWCNHYPEVVFLVGKKMMKLGVEFDNHLFDYCFYFATSFVRDPSLRTKYEFDSQFDQAIIKKVNNYLNHTYGIAVTYQD